MIILLRKKTLACVLLLGCFILTFSSLITAQGLKSVSAFSPQKDIHYTLIIDPGHGGEDGGAVSPSGVAESGINLGISLKLRDLMTFMGKPTLMTRSDDRSLDSGEPSVHQRKASDLKARTALVNQTDNAVLLSIHQNSLPSSPITRGAQVFWNTEAGAQELAEYMQAGLNHYINSGNEKHTRQIPSGVYLMKHITAPGALVECGFLSNPEEVQWLLEDTYQRKLAVSIGAGCLRWFDGEEPT